ncbi:biliverdin-producing heme oxygenase [Paenibacillus chitinolyticus]|uniref:biliverdin-producing heme oxygenase n=1 Tax=Paenibacillus chitinolyticus TaxID=79263 RepID=UPI0026E4D6E2|nr:biliverdin-producing heme oxygenase [Paenibacillus chitinolyticus]GKS12279.1 biliverdin-producing heme oxygenase [Paenibacillus chitinolyticus]
MTTTIVSRLREETAPFHDQIEQNPYAKAIMDKSLTLETYRTYLEKFYGFILPSEKALSTLPEWEERGFDIESRLKTPLLENDLEQLGLTKRQIEELPRCGNLPDVSTLPRALGYLYVLEGSTLGGQLITKQLKAILSVDPEVNGRYFNSYGAELRTKWSEFREFLLENVKTEEQEQVLAAAKETFILLDQWLKEIDGSHAAVI